MSKVIGAVFTVIPVAVSLLLSFQMRKGKNWARILLTIRAALSVLLTVLFVGSATTVVAITSIVVTLLNVAAVVFMFRPAANAYFDEFKRPKRPKRPDEYLFS